MQDKSEFDADELAASLRDLERLPSPRVIKSHLPFDLLPAALVNTSKVVQHVPLTFIQIKNSFGTNGPGGRVVNTAN